MWVSLGGWSETHVCPIDKIIMALSLFTCVKLGFHQRCKHIVAPRRRKRVLMAEGVYYLLLPLQKSTAVSKTGYIISSLKIKTVS